MQVQLRVTVTAGVLIPAGHGQIRLAPLARLPAVHPARVRTQPRIPGLCLEERKSGLVRRVDHLIQRGDLPRPERLRLAVAVLLGPAGILAQRRMKQRGALAQRKRQIKVWRRLPRFPGCLITQLPLPLRRGVRLFLQQPGVQVLGHLVRRHAPTAQARAIHRVHPLAEHQVIGFALDLLPIVKAQRLRSWTPPAPRRLTTLSRPNVVSTGLAPVRGRADLGPGVLDREPLVQGSHAGHCRLPAAPRRP
jgi:hypothetical protein